MKNEQELDNLLDRVQKIDGTDEKEWAEATLDYLALNSGETKEEIYKKVSKGLKEILQLPGNSDYLRGLGEGMALVNTLVVSALAPNPDYMQKFILTRAVVMKMLNELKN